MKCDCCFFKSSSGVEQEQCTDFSVTASSQGVNQEEVTGNNSALRCDIAESVCLNLSQRVWLPLPTVGGCFRKIPLKILWMISTHAVHVKVCTMVCHREAALDH